MMRVSADVGDPDFIGPHDYGRYLVRLNGLHVKDCVEADDHAGYVVTFMRNAAGSFMLDADKREVLRRRVEGVVQVIDKQRL